MFYKSNWHIAGILYGKFAIIIIAIVSVVGCSGGAPKPKPAELPANAALLSAKLAWSNSVGVGNAMLAPAVNEAVITVAGADGSVAALDAQTGKDIWRATVAGGIAAGVGSDGKYTAVVSKDNELVVFDAGREIWRAKLNAQGFTAPLVAGGRVFAMTADRSVAAFDAKNGKRLWTQTRAVEPLVLNSPGVMLPVADTLVVGQSGRLVGLNPNGGAPRWEAPIASPRGVNDIERLVDLVGRVSRVEDSICARAFQTSVGCVNATRGTVQWTKPANGATGLHGDERFVYGTESDGKVIAWRRENGERAWTSERLLFRGLTAPLAVGRSVAIGDATGLLHFISREDGSPLNRLSTDGSPIVTAPVLADGSVVVVTKAGGVFGFRAE
jgi:outer membrane protein assembly factor BamB